MKIGIVGATLTDVELVLARQAVRILEILSKARVGFTAVPSFDGRGWVVLADDGRQVGGADLTDALGQYAQALALEAAAATPAAVPLALCSNARCPGFECVPGTTTCNKCGAEMTVVR